MEACIRAADTKGGHTILSTNKESRMGLLFNCSAEKNSRKSIVDNIIANDRRDISDRRSKPTPPFSRYSFKGRRKAARRTEEAENYYVDRYESRYLILIAAIMCLCFLDAFLTAKLLQMGAVELNVFMLVFMEKNMVLAFIVKYALTAICLTYVLIHKNFKIFRRLRTKTLVYSVLGIYLILVAYEIYSYILCLRM